MTTTIAKEHGHQHSSITLYLVPEEKIQLSSWVCPDANQTISFQDREYLIKNHIDKFAKVWEELAKY